MNTQTIQFDMELFQGYTCIGCAVINDLALEVEFTDDEVAQMKQLVSKIDAMEAFDFDPERFRENLAGCNPDAPVFFLSGATGEGVPEWAAWLEQNVRDRSGK